MLYAIRGHCLEWSHRDEGGLIADARLDPAVPRPPTRQHAGGLLIWGINTIFLLDAALSNLEAFAANAFFTAGMVLFEMPFVLRGIILIAMFAIAFRLMHHVGFSPEMAAVF